MCVCVCVCVCRSFVARIFTKRHVATRSKSLAGLKERVGSAYGAMPAFPSTSSGLETSPRSPRYGLDASPAGISMTPAELLSADLQRRLQDVEAEARQLDLQRRLHEAKAEARLVAETKQARHHSASYATLFPADLSGCLFGLLRLAELCSSHAFARRRWKQSSCAVVT